MRAFDYAIAENAAGVLAATARGYRIKAAGIDVLDLLKERTAAPDKLVSIHEIADLRRIHIDEQERIVIGALATLQDVHDFDAIRGHFGALAIAAGDAATPQIRARATVGGNICQRPRCWYFRSQDFNCLKKGGATCFAVEGENAPHALFGGGPCYIVHPSNIAPALVAFGAEVLVRSSSGERAIPAGEFFLLPGDGGITRENVLRSEELVTGVRLPAMPGAPNRRSSYVEFRERQSFDWPLASCAAAFDGAAWNVVLGHVAPVPWRAVAANEVLGSAGSITPELAEKAADAALEGARPMRDNAWRLKLVRAAVRRALLKADGKDIDA
ncbi:MAG: FAD binding domain-containing protein [Candidatus Sumerlaeia bacterium]|nr:FAD binding domain-containing protein [Candidatus Sumerlaeia bacterium]